MRRASGSFGTGGRGLKVDRSGSARSKTTASRDRDQKIENKSVLCGRLDMPSKEELRESLDSGYCWSCGRTHSTDGKEMRHWSMHFVRAHSLDLLELRDILMVSKTYAFVTPGLKVELLASAKIRHERYPDTIRAAHAALAAAKPKRKFGAHGRRVQREKSERYFRGQPGGAEGHMRRISKIRSRKCKARRKAVLCEFCGVSFCPLHLHGAMTRTTCSHDCHTKLRTRRGAKTARKMKVCSQCGRDFWRPGGRSTCSDRCALEAVSRDSCSYEKRARGEGSSRSKLTDADVLKIRHRYANGGISQSSLAREYGINQGTVSSIVLGATWAHIGGPVAVKKSRQEASALRGAR